MSLSQEQQERLIGNILVAPGNELCADCGASEPTWASVNNSVLVCFHCAGVHRSFGTRVSAIKSVKLDKWDVEDINVLSKGVSNEFINETLLEYCVPDSAPAKPHSKSSHEVRESYIRAKYLEKAFLPGKDRKRQAPSVSTEDMNTLFDRICVQSAGCVEYVGIVRVKILSGQHIGGNIPLKSLPYVCIALGTQVLKTKLGTDRRNPTFQEELMFSWNGSDCLNMEIMDEDSFVRDETLGCCSIDLSSLELPAGGAPLYLDVSLQEVSSGTLQMELYVDNLDH